MDINENLKFKLQNIPHKPGCYLWKDKYDQVIYVGKASDLYKRTHQYFLSNRDQKTSKLVENIANIDFITVNNENESLILENNLIKKYQPKYNILLKEGTYYPYIVLTDEKNPRLVYTRSSDTYRGKYYGPFATSKSNKYEIYNFLLRLFPLRKCYKLPKKPCLYYDMGECLAPCINNITKEQYDVIKKDIDNFFKGNAKSIVKSLKEKERKYSQNFKYEEAQNILELIKGIEEINQYQNINFVSKHSIDVLGFYVNKQYISIVILSYVNGKLLTKKQQIAEINDSITETIESYLMQFYSENLNLPKKCYVGLEENKLKNLTQNLKVNFINPKTGKFKNILENAILNAKEFYNSNYLQYKRSVALNSDAFDELRKVLKIDNLTLIHIFDMSNLFNEDRIGAMVALENGNFNKNLYRKFIIKNEKAHSDVEYIKEVITRQYSHMLKNREELPNLIIADGGKQQVHTIIKSLKENKLNLIIPVIGLVKNRKHQTEKIYLPNGEFIPLDKNSELYLYLLKIQNEVHRFAITFFRTRKQSSLFKSKLEEIPEIGNATINKLLNNYQNMSSIKDAAIEEIAQYVGLKKAKIIKKHLQND